MRRAILSTILICSSASLICPSPSRADILYEKDPSLPGGYNTITSSITDTSGNYYLALDDFKLSSNSVVSSIDWQGMYIGTDPATGAPVNASPDTTQWLFGIYTATGSGDFPFTLVADRLVDPSQVTETLAGSAPFTYFGGTQTTTIDYYDESVSLGSGFTLQGNQTYYLGIFSFNSGSGDDWSWNSSNTGDGSSYQYNTYSNQTGTQSLDRTFTLQGSAVPEPSSLVLASIGAAGFLARRAGGKKARIANH